MIHILSFEIDPIAKGRPQFAHHAFTPTRTREYENAIAVLAREQFTMEPFTGPLSVTIDFYMPTKDKKRWGHWHTMKPDRTNLNKSVEDALNGIVWEDDSLIAIGPLGFKKWAPFGCIEVTVEELEPLLVSRKVIAASDLVFKKLDAKIAKSPKLKAIYEKAKREAQDACDNQTITGEQYLKGVEQ